MRYLFLCCVLVFVNYISITPISATPISPIPIYHPRYRPSYSNQIQKLLRTLNVTSENLLNKIHLASVTKNSTTDQVKTSTEGNSEVTLSDRPLSQVLSSTGANSEVTYTESPLSNHTYYKLIDLKLITLTTRSTPTTTSTTLTGISTTDSLPKTTSNISTIPKSETSNEDEKTFNYKNVTDVRKSISRNHEPKRNVHHASTKLSVAKDYKNAQEFKVKTSTFKVRSNPFKEKTESPSGNKINHGELECMLKQSAEIMLPRENFENLFQSHEIPQDNWSDSSSDETNSTATPPLTDKTFYTVVTDALLLVVSDMVHQKGPLSFEMKPGLEFTVGNLGYITRAGPIELNHPKNGRQKMIHFNIIVGPLSITRGKNIFKPQNDFKFYLKGDMEIRIKRNVKRDVVIHLTDLEIGSTNRQIMLIKGVKKLATSNTYEMIQDFLYQMEFESILKTSVEEALKMDSIHKTFIAIPEFLPFK